MTTPAARSAVLLAVVGLAVLGMVAPTPAAAQESGAGNATAEENTTETTNVAADVDDDIRVLDYWYNASSTTFYVELENTGDYSKDVTITEVIDRDAQGARKFGITVVGVSAGETLVAEVSAERVDGAAGVMVLTQAAVESGSGVYLQESRTTDNRLIKGDPDGSHVRSAGLFGSVGSLFLVLCGAWQYIAMKNRDIQRPSLDPNIGLLGRFRKWRR